MNRDSLATTWIISLSALLSIAWAAWADDGSIEAVSGAVRAMKPHATIEMESEFVHLRVQPNRLEAECVFVLHNHGPATRVTIGFPSRSSGADVNRATPFESFRSFVDGAPVPARELPDSSFSGAESFGSWWVKEVAFGRDQRRCVRDLYVARPGSSYPDTYWIEYVLETGATWAGPIGVADIVLTLDGVPSKSITSIDPKPTSRSDHEIRWHFENIEPDLDSGLALITLRWRK